MNILGIIWIDFLKSFFNFKLTAVNMNTWCERHQLHTRAASRVELIEKTHIS